MKSQRWFPTLALLRAGVDACCCSHRMLSFSPQLWYFLFLCFWCFSFHFLLYLSSGDRHYTLAGAHATSKPGQAGRTTTSSSSLNLCRQGIVVAVRLSWGYFPRSVASRQAHASPRNSLTVPSIHSLIHTLRRSTHPTTTAANPSFLSLRCHFLSHPLWFIVAQL